MKKNNLFLFATILFAVGCSKTESRTTRTTASNSPRPTPSVTGNSREAIQKFKEERDQEVSRQIYLGMSSRERHQVWMDHFEAYKQIDSVQANARKIALIEELEASLSSGVFETMARNATAIFLNYTLPKWTQLAEKVFSPREIYDLTYEGKGTEPVTEIGNTVSPGAANCFCHVGNVGYGCKLAKLKNPPGGDIIYGICEHTDDCKASSLGCGSLWLSSCNGSHCNFG